MSNIKLAIVGATGDLKEFLRILAEQQFPAENLFGCSSKSAGKQLNILKKL